MKTAFASVKFWLALLATIIFGLGVSVKAAELPGLSITSPVADQKIVGSTIPVTLSVTNFSLVDFRLHPKLVRGEGHVHLWLDQATNDPMSAIKIFNDNYTFENVKPGIHTLVAELVNNNHSQLVPPVRTTVTFTTTDTAPTSGIMSVSPLLISISAFLFLLLVLYFVNNQARSRSNSGKSPKKSSPKSSKRSR
jgi:hypothetical protein